MRLLEFRAKQLFAQYDIPIPQGQVVTALDQVPGVMQELGGAVMLKAQVPAGGRGKAGAVQRAVDPEKAREKAATILGGTVQGHPVAMLLVEEALDVAEELYLAITLDRTRRRMVLMASSQGGVDVEARAVKSTRAAKSARVLCQIPVDPLVGLRTHQIWELATAIDLDEAFVSDFIGVVRGLYDCAIACEALLAEINPLVVTAQGQLIAVDAKVELDDNALFRHSDLAQRDDWKKDPAQAQAEKLGVSYIRLDGEIGCMVNGAGLAMATMDLIHLYGRAPANFLDIGGGAGGAKVEGALRLILADERVRSVLINIFGGITRCDEVARGIVAALDLLQPAVPVVARLVGTNAEAGQRILAQADVTPAHSLSDAVRQVTELAGEDAV